MSWFSKYIVHFKVGNHSDYHMFDTFGQALHEAGSIVSSAVADGVGVFVHDAEGQLIGLALHGAYAAENAILPEIPPPSNNEANTTGEQQPAPEPVFKPGT